MSIAIKAENISKAYQIGEFSTGTISKDIDRWWKLLRGKEDPYLKIGETNDRSTKGDSNIVWSLKDINFEINQGDAVGIIGKNGAGKSTLLKVLSRVTTPTTGNVKVKGRIASLLEVGTGFHPELTGKENIYLNGAILGMRKHEIKKHFDAIVDFSGVERYIDTPVKRYSSGMYVRLAFAVAAHLESEILIVDEVLAVGDAEFQKKCLGKMGEVSSKEGRTVLFVSHNLAAVRTLCSKGMLLKNGKMEVFGELQHVINNYEISYDVTENPFLDLRELERRSGNGNVKFEFIELLNSQGPTRIFSIGDDLIIKYKIKRFNEFTKNAGSSIKIKRSDGLSIAYVIHKDSNFEEDLNDETPREIIFNDIRLYPGIYYIDLIIGTANVEFFDLIENCISFEIKSDGQLTSRSLPQSNGIMFYTPIWRLVN